MPPATPVERRLVVTYLVTGSTKLAAAELRMSHDSYRRRLSRIYRRQGVRNMAALVVILGCDVSQTAQWTREDADASI